MEEVIVPDSNIKKFNFTVIFLLTNLLIEQIAQIEKAIPKNVSVFEYVRISIAYKLICGLCWRHGPHAARRSDSNAN